MEYVAAIITFIGSVFLLLGALGVLRMPDVYNKIQAGTKATTLGTMLTLLGVSLYHPGWFLKLVVLVLFILFTSPISSHVLVRAAHYAKAPLSKNTVLDRLKESEDQI